MDASTMNGGSSDEGRQRLVRVWAAGKAIFGAAAFVAPRFVGRQVVGAAGDDAGSIGFARGLGGRDVALGIAALAADTPRTQRRALLLGSLGDAADVVATLRLYDGLPRRTRLLALTAAVGMVVSGVALAATAPVE